MVFLKEPNDVGNKVVDLSSDHCVQIEPLPSTKATDQTHHNHKCRRSTKIAAAITIIATLVAVASATAALYYFGTTHVYLNEKRTNLHNPSSQVEQETNVDSTTNYVKYSIRTETSDPHKTEVLVDTNMALQIYKVTTQDTVSCFLTPIMFSPSPDDSVNFLTNTTSLNLTMINRETTMQTSSKPIPDTGILGERGREFCNTDKVYWSLQQPSNQQINHQKLDQTLQISALHNNNPKIANNSSKPPIPQTLRRVKRQSSLVYVCLWDWNNCYFFTFPDDRTKFRYYRCQIRCRFVDRQQFFFYR